MKWECVVVESDWNTQWEVVDANGRVEKRSGHGIKWGGHASESIQNFLNRYGAAGWELVAVGAQPKGNVLYLKRQVG
jgi:hypothetical protein